MLKISLAWRESKVNPCIHLGITDPKIVWEMEIAMQHRLMFYDAERDKDKAQLTNLAVMSANVGRFLDFGQKEILDISQAEVW